MKKKANRKSDAPVDATKGVNGAFEITYEKEGVLIDADSTVAKKMFLKDKEETIVADVTKQKPRCVTAEVATSGCTWNITTNYSSSTAERATNIAVGTAKMDGITFDAR